MTSSTKALFAGLALVCAIARPATAQITWDTPRLIGPETPAGLGFYWMRSETLPGDENAVFGSFSLPGTSGRVSVRGGLGTGVAEENAFFGGVDLRAPITRHTATQPLDLEWSGGAGASYGEYLLVSVPFAVSAGRSWASGAVWFAPYVTVGATLDYRYGESDFVPDEEYEVQATAGLGVDMAFDAARRFVFRAAAAMGERQAVSVGLLIGG